MGDVRRSFGRDALTYLKDVDHWLDVVLAAIGGYAAAMFVWEMAHPAILSAFLLKNALPLEARRTLALLLIGGIAAALGVWLLLGWARSRSRARSVAAALHRAARLIFLAAPLPLVPILAIPGLEKDAPFFVFGIVAALAALTFVAVRGVLTPMPDVPAARETSNVKRETSSVERQTSYVKRQASSVARSSSFIVHHSSFIITLVLAAGYALFMSALSVARHNGFMTHAFDLGIHDQAIYNILHGGTMRTTLYGPYAIDYIGDHFSPILYLVAPIYALYQDARTLLVLQSFFLAAGAIPIYLLARNKTRSALLAVTLATAYLLYPALHGVNLKDFHQIALVCVLLLAALYFLEIERDVPLLIALGLALIVKEEVSLTVAAIGAYIFLAKRRYRLGVALALIGLAYFAVVTGWLMPHLGGKPQIDTRFGGIIAPDTQGAAGVAWTLFTNPVYTAMSILGNQQKLIFLFQMLLPVLFLPLLAPALAWIPALPALGVLLLTSAYTQYNITYHYSAHLIPFIFFLAILGATRFLDMSHRATAERADTSSAPAPALHRTAFGANVSARPHPRTIALAASLLVASLAMSYQFGQIIPKHGPEFFRVAFPRPDPHAAVVERFVRQIPREAVVSTMSDIATHLTARRTIYLFPDVADAEYLLLDTDPRANYWPHEGLKARERALRDMLPQIRSGQFGLVRSEDGVMLLKRGSDPAHNDAALRTLYSARYEAEEMSSDLDAPAVADPQASRGQARMATPASIGPDGKTALVFGPYADLPPGKYRAEFILKTDRTDRAERVATVDVFTHKDGYARATREIPGTDFAAPDRYQPFAIEFESDKPLEDLEYRVQYGGVGTLGLDAVRVTPVELWLK
ncbi:MAG: DUF2079 domain-containing protein [Anaerolineae bacterium]|nr:DUF2079 domain-containing protein [Anaerolineae bacterium]